MRAFLDKDSFATLHIDRENSRVYINLDQSKIFSQGREAIKALLLDLHMWHCTADVKAAEKRYGELTSVTDEWLAVRDMVIKSGSSAWIFVQGNTFLGPDGNVTLKEYDATPLGVLQSWVDRTN